MSATLPPGWAWVPVGDLVVVPSDLTDGPFGSNLKTEHYRDSGPRVIRLQNIGDGRFVDDEAHISTTHFARLRKHEAIPGDVVVAMLGSDLPRACLVPPSLGPAIVKADCVRLRPDDRIIDGRYAVAALNSPAVRRQAERLVHGVGRPRLGLRWFRPLRIPLAPVAEQARLVDAVDSHLSRLDAAVANLEAAQLKLKAYRASVLKAAVEGRLVPTEAELARKEGRSYEPADVLLERILKERRRRWEQAELAKMTAAGNAPTDDRWKGKYPLPDQPDAGSLPCLPSGWCWATVDQVGDVLLGRQRAPQFLTGDWSRLYLRVANIKDDRIDFDDLEEMDFGPEHFEKYRLQAGDILVSEGQSPHLVGQSATYRGEVDGLCFQKTLHRFRPFAPGPTSEFAQTVFRAHVSLGVFKAVASITTNIAHLTLEKFKRSRFPLPPAGEQMRIVEEIARKMSVADASERAIAANRARLRRLRQSILAWAFEGKLVDQNPAEEPVPVLLDRISSHRRGSGEPIRAAGVAIAPTAPRAKRPRKLKAAS